MKNSLTPQEIYMKLKAGKRLSEQDKKVLSGSLGGYVPNVEKQKKGGNLSKSQKSLKDWTNQEWMTSGTHSNQKKGSNKEVKSKGKKRYLPKRAWDNLSSGEKAATNKAKASSKKQFVKQPKSIADKAAQYRKEGGVIMKNGGKTKSKVNEAGNYTKPGMRKRLFQSIKAGSKGGNPGQWSARKAQLLAKKYKSKGGGYKQMGGQIIDESAIVNNRSNEVIEDSDGEMVLGQLASINDKVIELQDIINTNTELEPWVNKKITLADAYIDTVTDYLKYDPESTDPMMKEGGLLAAHGMDLPIEPAKPRKSLFVQNKPSQNIDLKLPIQGQFQRKPVFQGNPLRANLNLVDTPNAALTLSNSVNINPRDPMRSKLVNPSIQGRYNMGNTEFNARVNFGQPKPEFNVGINRRFKKGGYTVTRSNDRKGKTHKVTGPDGSVKYFGDPKLGERSKSKYGKEAFYKRHAKNLKNNPHFRAYARKTWQDGGEVYNMDEKGLSPLYGLPTPDVLTRDEMFNQYFQTSKEDYSPDFKALTKSTPLRENKKTDYTFYYGNPTWWGESGNKFLQYNTDVDHKIKQKARNKKRALARDYETAPTVIGSDGQPYKMTQQRVMDAQWATNRLPSMFNKTSNSPFGAIAKGKSGIHIKPENKGKFTAKANAAGMGVQEYARKVLAADEGRYDTSTRRQANFARNAAKWKKQKGGYTLDDPQYYIQPSYQAPTDYSWSSSSDSSKVQATPEAQYRTKKVPHAWEREYNLEQQGYDVDDPMWENILEGVDFTGYFTWDDLQRDIESGQTDPFNAIGVIPAVGKLKNLKYFKPATGINLMKGSRKKAFDQLQRNKAKMKKNLQRWDYIDMGTDAIDTPNDVYKDNISKMLKKGGKLSCMRCGGYHKPGVMCHGGHMDQSFEIIDEQDILHPGDSRRLATRENNNPVGFKFTKTFSKQY